MNKTELLDGKVVKLKSGGQKMTVGDDYGNTALCYWFDSQGNFQKQEISKNALKVIDPEEK